MDNDPTAITGFEKIVLAFGLALDPQAWVDMARLVPLAGAGLAARRCVSDALQVLEQRELVEIEHVAGTALYRRTQLGIDLASGLLADDESSFLRELSNSSSSRSWKNEPGAPRTLSELVGQDSAKYLVLSNLDWAKRTGRMPASMLLYGPPGSGKTLLAGLIAREMGISCLHLSMADVSAQDVHVALTVAAEGALVFLDELHAAPRRLRDALLVALDPSQSRSFAFVGGTTDPGSLGGALRRRFTLEVGLDEYTLSEAQELARRRASLMGLNIEDSVTWLIARASRANPARVTRYVTEAAMLVEGTDDVLTADMFREHLRCTNRDERGVDSAETEILLFLRDQAAGPAGMGKLVDALGLDSIFIRERLHYLRREGLIRNHGKAGHALSTEGRDYLKTRGL